MNRRSTDLKVQRFIFDWHLLCWMSDIHSASKSTHTLLGERFLLIFTTWRQAHIHCAARNLFHWNSFCLRHLTAINSIQCTFRMDGCPWLNSRKIEKVPIGRNDSMQMRLKFIPKSAARQNGTQFGSKENSMANLAFETVSSGVCWELAIHFHLLAYISVEYSRL